jgi:hypothetical protein
MTPVIILNETGMSLTEQRKQPLSFMRLVMLDINAKRAAENEKARKQKRQAKKHRR